MTNEYSSLIEYNAWKLVELHQGRTAIGCKWLFKHESDENGTISRYKARLVAQGYNQIYGIDYDEVYAPVAKITTLRTLLVIAGDQNLTVMHADVKTAFLNGTITETIYMKQPEGFEVKSKEHLVCKLEKGIYGLKQAARNWNNVIHNLLIQQGFTASIADPCLYTKCRNGMYLYVLLYVDDLIIACKDKRLIDELMESLGHHLEIRNLGEIRHCLGICFERDSGGYFHIHQRKYIEQMIKQMGLGDAKDSKIPMDTGYMRRTEPEIPFSDIKRYQEAIGILLYIAVNTRPDIAICASILGRKVSNPSVADWIEVKRVFRYLKGTSALRLTLGSNEESSTRGLIGYADADWAGDTTDRKSTSAYVFKLYGGAISWSCRKQTCVTLSSTEAEYVSLSEACQEAVWLEKLLKDFQVQDLKQTLIYEDNQSCLKQLEEGKISKRSKHVETKYHFAKNLKTQGKMDFSYCRSELMCADLLTKLICVNRLKHLKLLIGLQ